MTATTFRELFRDHPELKLGDAVRMELEEVLQLLRR